MSDDSRDEDADHKESNAKRPSVLIRSTLGGLGLGLLAGIAYMFFATYPDGGGVKGTEWLFITFVGCVLGVVVGIILDAIAQK